MTDFMFDLLLIVATLLITAMSYIIELKEDLKDDIHSAHR